MAYEEVLKSISLDADASIGIYTGVPGTHGSLAPNSGKQYHFVKVTGKNTAGLAGAGDGAAVIGVLQNKPQMVGDAATVGILGVTNVEAGGTVTPSQGVSADADGRAVGGAVSGTSLGVCLTGGAVGQLISVLLK